VYGWSCGSSNLSRRYPFEETKEWDLRGVGIDRMSDHGKRPIDERWFRAIDIDLIKI